MNLFDLIERLENGTISADEIEKLYKLPELNDPQIANLLDEAWNRSSDKGIDKNVLINQYQKLQDKLKINADHTTQQNKPVSISKVYIFGILKYAAVLLIGFFIAWLIFSEKKVSMDHTEIATKYHVVKVANGSKSTISLPDGSVVHLNSGSQLSYPVSFGISNRDVTLEGEGFFEIAKNARLPFYVKTSRIIVKAIGTSFNVKSYPDDDITETTLITGSVEIYQNKPNNSSIDHSNKLAVLNPSEIAVVSNKSISIDRLTNNQTSNKKSIEPEVVISKSKKAELNTEWTNDVLVFNNEKFMDIIKKLERWYNVEILLEFQDLSTVRFSGKFDRESIQDVLDALNLIEPFSYMKDKNNLTIYKK